MRTLSKCADPIKLGGAVGTLRCMATIQGAPSKLKRWADRNLTQLSESQCRALHLWEE